MANPIGMMSTPKHTTRVFMPKSRPCAPMVTYCPDMREGDRKGKFLSDRRICNYKVIDAGNARRVIEQSGNFPL